MNITFGREKAGVLFGRAGNTSLALLLEETIETIDEPGKLCSKMCIAIKINSSCNQQFTSSPQQH
jgi:hypothetical protein